MPGFKGFNIQAFHLNPGPLNPFFMPQCAARKQACLFKMRSFGPFKSYLYQ